MTHKIKFFYSDMVCATYDAALEGLQTAINQFLECPVECVEVKLTVAPNVIIAMVVYKDLLRDMGPPQTP